MAIKKKTKKKATKSKKATGKKVTSKKERARRRTTPRKSAKKKAIAKKPAAKSTSGKKTIARNTVLASNRRTQDRTQRQAAFPRERPRSHSGDQSGDLQGLSNIEAADSESVDELLEEGNAFEADAVAGVQDADDADEREVHTHEVPEDDVPGEYLDEE
jgi:hypothetical protein